MTEFACPKCHSTNVQPVRANEFRCAQCDSALRLYPLPGAYASQCPQCKAALLDDACYCHLCGAPVQTLVAVSLCTKCGHTMPATAVFCPYCRTPNAVLDQERPAWELRQRETSGCPACGQNIGPTAEVCPYCGVNVEAFLAPLRQRGLDNLPAFDQAHGYDTRLIEDPPMPSARRARSSQLAPVEQVKLVLILIVLGMLMALVLILLVAQFVGRGV